MKITSIRLQNSINFEKHRDSSHWIVNATITETDIQGIVKINGVLQKTLSIEDEIYWASFAKKSLDEWIPKDWPKAGEPVEVQIPFIDVLTNFLFSGKWVTKGKKQFYEKKWIIQEDVEVFVTIADILKLIN